MPEQPAELQRINWLSCCPFTQVFRTFKMALHPSKLGLALAALLLIGLWGWALDRVWLTHHKPVADEVHAFWQRPNIDAWRQDVLDKQLENVRSAYDKAGASMPAEVAADLKKDPRQGVNSALADLARQYKARIDDKNTKAADVPGIAAAFNAAYEDMERYRTCGVFSSFLKYETAVVRSFIDAAATLNLAQGLREVMTARQGEGLRSTGRVIEADDLKLGALPSLILMVRGVQWLVTEHCWFALLLFIGKLAVWGFFGGAICRMAALNFARDERIPLRAALSFARRKYVGFVTAPLLPIALILGMGAFLILGGFAIGSIPYIGGVLAGLGMILALMAGFVMSLVLIGLLAGGGLMWPTIAVEGSDSFDAMSRSYSYVYSRPWRAALYALVVAVYGAICYLFLRFFVWLMLRLARGFVGIGMGWLTSRPGTGVAGAGRIDAIWPIPTFDALLRPPPAFAAAYWDDQAAYVLITIWVGLLALLLCSFLVTFYFSATTIIYYLLRREVDATDLEDVYSEEIDEEEILQAGTSPAPAPAAESSGGLPPSDTGEAPARA